jgi:plastocyanin
MKKLMRPFILGGGLLLTGLIAIIWLVTLLPVMNPGYGQSTLVITIKAEGMQFDISTLTVKAGQPITLRFENHDTMAHGIAIDTLNIRTAQIGPNQVTTVTFTPKEPGTYVFYCFVNAHRQLGMEGILEVIL